MTKPASTINCLPIPLRLKQMKMHQHITVFLVLCHGVCMGGSVDGCVCVRPCVWPCVHLLAGVFGYLSGHKQLVIKEPRHCCSACRNKQGSSYITRGPLFPLCFQNLASVWGEKSLSLAEMSAELKQLNGNCVPKSCEQKGDISYILGKLSEPYCYCIQLI